MFKRQKTDSSDPIALDRDDEREPAAPGEATGGKSTGSPAAGPRTVSGVGPVVLLAGKPADSGLGVPPFRPAQPKEAQFMGRAPFNISPAAPPGPPTPAAGPRPASLPAGRLPIRDTAERRMLVVGRGISLQGTVQNAERLVVEGTVEASTIQATELSITPGGVFKGEIEVEDAEIAGTIDGTLTARNSLIVHATGRVLGTARCRRLQVEDGGHITGRVEMLSEPAKLEMPRSTADSAA